MVSAGYPVCTTLGYASSTSFELIGKNPSIILFRLKERNYYQLLVLLVVFRYTISNYELVAFFHADIVCNHCGVNFTRSNWKC